MNESSSESGVLAARPSRGSSALPLAVALTLLVALVVWPGGRAGRTLDLRDAPELAPVGLALAATFPRSTVLRIPPWNATLTEGDRALEWVSSADEVASLGSGRFTVSGRTVVFASTDGSDVRANGRRYELGFEADRIELARSPLVVALALGTLALFVLAVKKGTVVLGRASPERTRAVLVLAVAATLLAGTVERWSDVAFNEDSGSYLGHSTIRPALYPTFLDLLDRQPGVAREPTHRTERPVTDPGNRWLRAAQVQKLATIAAIATLVWTLSSTLNAWLLAALLGAAAFLDTEHLGGDASVWWNATAIMSEGLNHALVFLLFAALFAYLERPRAAIGVALGLVLALLLLDRPANVALGVAVPFAWWGDRAREGWRRATKRAAWIALAAAIPLVLASAWTWHAHGRFRLHSFTGPSVFALALQTATPDDVAAFDDPVQRRLAQACIVDAAPLRIADFHTTPRGEYVNRNLYAIALPAFARTVEVPAGEDPSYYADDLFLLMGKRLIARHPLAYAEIVFFHFRKFFDPVLEPLALLAALGALVLWRRTGAFEALYALFWAVLPTLYMAPSCCFNVPFERYRSQVYFAEYLALPFLGVVLLSLGRARLGGASQAASAP